MSLYLSKISHVFLWFIIKNTLKEYINLMIIDLFELELFPGNLSQYWLNLPSN